jgi:SNF2 family DNA or RNA helicase
MQVITLLVVIAESSASPDESVRSQIPENLRESKTLILCPPSLVDNWHDEIRMWAPGEVLGPMQRVDTVPSTQRMKTIEAWNSSGGVLILGYTMFTNLVQNRAAAKILWEGPNLVIGDEAHYIKNPESLRHRMSNPRSFSHLQVPVAHCGSRDLQRLCSTPPPMPRLKKEITDICWTEATANFKTMNRIAMTGSPLTNNVMDYYAMINWVAPNYLANIGEFRDRFEKPIKEGLYADSEPHQKRRARRMLHVLKETVGPKVHRRDIEGLLHELPKKKEFIIMLPLTKLQTRLYKTYIEWVTDPSREQQTTGQAKVWSLVAKLGLVLAHPFIFKTEIEAKQAKPSGSTAQSSKPPTAGDIEEDDVEVPQDVVEVPQDVLIRLLTTLAVRDVAGDYALSNKILVLLQILNECRKVGDKVLVFSQSISTLDYIENILRRQRVVYQRLDGQTPMSTRQDSAKKFNTGSECHVYLISTKTGIGLNSK